MEYLHCQRGDGHYYVRKDEQGGELYFGPYPNAEIAITQMETARKAEHSIIPGALQQNLNAPTKDSFLEQMPWRFK